MKIVGIYIIYNKKSADFPPSKSENIFKLLLRFGWIINRLQIFFLLLADTRTVIFFIASTFGNGDPPSTAFPFAKEMRSLLEKGAENQFPNLRYRFID